MEPKKEPPMGESEEAVEKREEDAEGEKRGGRVKKRARGGHMMHEGKKHEAPHHGRKRGGHVPGKASEHRPDRRARGGGADMHPETSAGKMSTMDYERGKAPARDEGGMGGDKRVTGE